MTARRQRAARLRTALSWIVLAGALTAATEPAWSVALLGYNPTLDDLLSLRCFAPLPAVGTQEP